MQKYRITRFVIISFIWASIIICAGALAQEDEYILEHRDIYGKLRRPAVSFSHENHVAALTDGGCGLCHHVQDEQNGKLAYVEGEELGCKECHLRRKDQGTPALREAYHGNCTGCHRRMIKQGHPKNGPTTCGGCHKKP